MRQLPNAAVALLALLAAGIASAAPATVEELIARYGLVAPPDRDEGPEAAELLAYQRAEVYHEAEALRSRFGPSVAAMRALFRTRAGAERPRPRDAAQIRRAIDQTFGVSRLGRGITIERSKRTGKLTAVDFTFGDGGFGQALVGVPARPNGILLIALHGCQSSPDAVMTDVRSYANSFGLRALERGFTVVAPYVLSQCGWIHNFDWLGSMSGVSVFGYELAKIREITEWAARTYGTSGTALWGISLGGQYAMLAGAMYPRLFDAIVISAAAADYEQSYLATFDSSSIDATRPLGANTQLALSSQFARAELMAAIAPRPLVLEIALNDLSDGAMRFVKRAEEIARERHAPHPRVLLFEGAHETNPDVTASVIMDILLMADTPDIGRGID